LEVLSLEKKLHVIRRYSINELCKLLEIPEDEEVVDIRTEVNENFDAIGFEIVTEVSK